METVREMREDPAMRRDGVRQRLDRAITHLGLNYAQVQRMAGLKETYLSEALRGRIRNGERYFSGKLEEFLDIAKLLNISPDWLQTGEGEMMLAKQRAAAITLDALRIALEETLAHLLRIDQERAVALADTLASIAQNPPACTEGEDSRRIAGIAIRGALHLSEDQSR